MSQVGIGTLLFCVLIGAICLWMLLLHRLSERLRAHHPSVYELLGRPSGVTRNTTTTRSAVMHFLVSGQHRTLNDLQLQRLGDMTLSTVLFIVVFGFALIIMAVIWPPTT